MAKVTGLGGAFLRVSDPKALYAWYEANLGVSAQGGFIMFPKEELRGYSLVSFFKKSSDHFPVFGSNASFSAKGLLSLHSPPA